MVEVIQTVSGRTTQAVQVGNEVADVQAAKVTALAEIATQVDTAEKWAQNPEDTPVVGIDQFSALHWATKAADSAVEADAFASGLGSLTTAVDAAETAQTAAEAAKTLAETAATNAQRAAYTTATWSALNAITGTAAGQGAEVLDADTGTHTDPVVGGTVANAGRFTWSASPAGWQRIGGTGLAAKLDTTTFSTYVADGIDPWTLRTADGFVAARLDSGNYLQSLDGFKAGAAVIEQPADTLRLGSLYCKDTPANGLQIVTEDGFILLTSANMLNLISME